MTKRPLCRAEWLGLLALVLLAAGTRFYGLDLQSLWNDEGTSVALAQRSLATIAEQAAQDIHPPLYYIVLHGWIRLVGISEVAVRSLSALLGVVVVVTTWAMARQLLERAAESPIPWIAGILVAVSPFQVYYAQEARMYMLVTCAGAASMLAWARLFVDRREPPHAIHWAFYVASGIAAIYSHYFAFTLILAQNIAWLIVTLQENRAQRPWWPAVWRRAWRWALAQLAIIAAYVPWLWVSWASLTRWPAVAEPLSFATLLSRIARVFMLGIHYPPGRLALAVAAAGALVAAAGALVAAVGTLARFRRGARWQVILYAAVPVVCMYVFSLSRPMYKPKFLLLATPAYHLLQACGLAVLADAGSRALQGRGRLLCERAGVWIFCVLLCLFPLVGVVNLYTDASAYRDDYRGIVAYIEATAGPEDALLINAPSQVETVDYYYQGELPEYALPEQRPLDWLATESRLTDLIVQHRRIYAIYWATDESDPESLIEGWMGAHCYEAMDRWYGNLRLVVYAVPQAPADEVQYPLNRMLGDKVILQGYSIPTPSPESGTILQVTLYWQALAQMTERYKVFVHLVDANGNIVAQRDSEPVGGSRATNTWTEGQVILDNYGLLLPIGVPPGAYTLRVGMYDGATGVRLPTDEQSQRDVVDAGVVDVSRPANVLPDAAVEVQVRHGKIWPGIELVGHSLHQLGHEHEDQLDLYGGDVLRLDLVWRAVRGLRATESWTLTLEDWRGRESYAQAFAPGSGVYPATNWVAGELVHDVVKVPLPDDLVAGRWRLMLTSPDGTSQKLQVISVRER